MITDNYFVAIPLPTSVKAVLAKEQKQFAHFSGVRCVRPKYFHLTVHFFKGFCPKKHLHSIANLLDQIAARHDPFGLELENLDMFFARENPRVIWSGVSGELDALKSLQKELTTALQSSGHHVDNRSFIPHITLARVHFSRDAKHIARQQGVVLRPISFFASSMCLYQSTVVGGSRVYLPLHKSVFSTSKKEAGLPLSTNNMLQDTQ